MGARARRTDTTSVVVDETDIAEMDRSFGASFATDDETSVAGTSDLDLIEGRGSFWSDFRLTGEKLGTGMCGTVVAAVHKRSGEKVAVKTLRDGQLSESGLVDLKCEIINQHALDHPHVARLRAVYRSPGSLRLVMEHLAGGDLCQHLEESGPLGEAATVAVIRQVLQAVDYMHGQGLVHRDIKPENIVYESSDRDRVKLVDFGLSTAWDEDMEPMSRICGTPSYLAPEVHKECYTSKVDLWCVGATTYTLLTGERLCRTVDGAPIFSRRFDDLSAHARSFITALLTVDPTSRMSASAALRHRWIHDKRCGKSTRDCRSRVMPPNPYLSRDTVQGSGQQTPLVEVENKKSLWQSMPSMFGSRRLSALWATARKAKASSRVAPEVTEQQSGASSGAWHGLIPPPDA